MAVIDLAGKTLTVKLVYYGCALGGKTTNLITLHRLTDPDGFQGLVSIATNDDRTLFFDLLPVNLGQVGGLLVKVKLYTVPGQVHYELTRRQVLAGADGVVLVADSSPEATEQNAWAIKNLRFNLKANGLDPDGTPTLIQWNKRDLPNARPVAEMDTQLNVARLPTVEAVAKSGAGVIDTFQTLLLAVIVRVYEKHGRKPPPDLEKVVGGALAEARARQPELAGQEGPKSTFDHRFNMDAYREEQAERGRDRRVVDQESLLSESVNANMMLAERLETLRQAQSIGERRGRMMQALARLAPMLADPRGGALPKGVTPLLLEGAQRGHGSLLLFRGEERVMDEHEVVPAGADVLNAIVASGLGSVAHQLARPAAFRVIDDLASEVLFAEAPPETAGLAGLLVTPLACDGLTFGALLIYSGVKEPAFDPTEGEFWKTASHLVGLSLHWHALRRKVQQTAGVS